MSATYQPGANAVRMPFLFTVEGLSILNVLRRMPDTDGSYPDLPALARYFGIQRRAVDVALDALIGREPGEAAVALEGRAAKSAAFRDLLASTFGRC